MSATTIAITLIGNDLTSGAFGSMVANSTALESRVASLGGGLGKLSPAMALTGATAVVAGAAFVALKDVLSYGIEVAADLEYRMVSLENALQANADMAPLLADAIADMAVRTMFSSADATDAFTRLVEMGFSAQQVLYGMDPAAKSLMDGMYHAKEALEGVGNQALIMAQAMRTDATEGAYLLGSAMHIFEAEGLSAKQTADLLAGAFLNGVPSAQSLTQALNMAGAGAATAGVHMDDFLVTLDLLVRNGMSASSAGASLNYMLQSLTAPTHKQKDALEALNLVVLGGADGYQILSSKLFDAQGNFVGLKRSVELLDQAMIGKTAQEKMEMFAELFNVRSGRAAKVLANIDDFDAQYNAIMQRFAGTDVGAMADKQLHTLLGAWDNFKDTFQTTMSNLFTPFEKQIAEPILKISEVISKLKELPDAVKQGLVAFLLIATVATAVTLAVAGIAFIIGILGSVMVGTTPLWVFLAGGIGIVAGIIAIATGAFFAAKATIEALGPHLKEIGGFFSALGTAAHGVWDWITKLVGAFASGFKPLLDTLGPAMKQVGDMLGGTIGPQLQALGDMVRVQLKPAWDDLVKAFQNAAPVFQLLIPYFQFLGIIVGGALAIAFGVLFAVVTGVLKALTFVITGLVAFFSGIVGIVSGVIQILLGIFTIFTGTLAALFTGNFDQLGEIWSNGWDSISHGAKDILVGFVTAVLGLIVALGGGLWGLLSGIVEGFISWFQHLFDVLVGHSIIPDMVNAIISWIAQLPGRAGAILASLVATGITKAIEFKDGLVNKAAEIPGKLGSLAQSMVDAARNGLSTLASIGANAGLGLMNNLLDAIRGKLGALRDLAGQAAATIGNLFHHSTPEEGPLKGDDEWGAEFMDNIINGMNSRTTTLRTAANLAASTLARPFTTPSSAASASVQSSSSGTITIPVSLDGRQIAEYTLDLANRKLVQSGAVRYAR